MPKTTPLKKIPEKMYQSVPWHIVGGLSTPRKMPCFSYSLPAQACNVGGRLRMVLGSVCSLCYACKGCYLWTTTIDAMNRRLCSVLRMLSDSADYERWISSMCKLLTGLRARYFRWHDSGDIMDLAHLEAIVQVAVRMPQVKFWLPTKEYGTIRQYLKHNGFPSNLCVRVSAPMVDGQAPNIVGCESSTVHKHAPPIGKECRAYARGGHCGNCRACWNIDIDNVSYPLH